MSTIPGEIGAGVTFTVIACLPVYPAPDWSIDLILRGPSQIDIGSVSNVENHELRAAASVTKDWKPGRYRYEIRASNGDDVVTVESGEVKISPDLSAQVAGFDGRDHVRRVLDAVEAVIENRATIDQQHYQINNRSLTRTPMADLLKLRAKYRDELAGQKRAHRGGGLGPQYKVRF